MLLGPDDPLPDDPLPDAPRRVLVAGASGAGKTTVAERIGRIRQLPHTEIDALHHGPGWQRRPEFLDDVRAIAASEAWVTEWQYDEVRPILLERADLMVWLDLPRLTVLRQVTWRTVHRRLGRTQLWNGNREGPLWRVLKDPEHVIRWAWSTHPLVAERVGTVLDRRPQLPVVRLRSRREVTRWLSGAACAGTPGPPH